MDIELNAIQNGRYVEEEFDNDGRQLPLISNKLPISHPMWIVMVVECCERVSYYGLSGVFMNYMSQGPDDKIKGLLHLGPRVAAFLSYAFQFWCYVCPIFGAWLADSFYGKYNVILYASFIYVLGIIVLFLGLFLLSGNLAVFVFILATICIGIGTGGIKANVSPLVADCASYFEPFTVSKKGKKYRVTHAATTLKIFMIFYFAINIGSLSTIVTTSLEFKYGFWSAYLFALVFFFIGVTFFIMGKEKYVIRPPTENVIGKSFEIIFMAIKLKSFAKCYHMNTWDAKLIDDVQKCIKVCKVFFFFIIYWSVYGQMLNNFITQASQMRLDGIPNDFLQCLNPIAILCYIPLFERVIYPFIRDQLRVNLTAILKIAAGFQVAALAMFYAGYLQWKIYKMSSCDDKSGSCDHLQMPNNVSVVWQIPSYVLIAISEILASVTGLEYAYTNAPATMKSFIMSLFLLTSAVGSLLGMAISPFARENHMVEFYCSLGIACAASGVFFWFFFRKTGTSYQAVQTMPSDDQE